ncbi:hypothetical protein B0T10DRAFT_595195 [Thelonectria olida]|uniref:RecQ-mediated genome instability protein 1 n=1 Tax=Thelonectria olida TaxID=1576542 RepID=A0A9P8W723_9HYPO|nr:hypothetical protein B0T10DRAFT_595195 [Thelonectria olida]
MGVWLLDEIIFRAEVTASGYIMDGSLGDVGGMAETNSSHLVDRPSMPLSSPVPAPRRNPRPIPPPPLNRLPRLSHHRPLPAAPLPSLVATAKARLLAADLTSPALFSIASLPSLPPHADAAATKELRLPQPVHVQVLDIENLSLSRWEQIEELEAVERGEMTRGREVVRVTAEDDENNTGVGESQATQRPPRTSSGAAANTSVRRAGKNATHRLVLQDCKGTKVYALELRRIDGVNVGKTQAGEKILLKTDTVIARGTVLLEPEKCVLLGGKVEAWQKVWSDGRLARLREAASREQPQRT